MALSLDAFIGAISGQESGGNYRAVNKDSGALGRYQILASNVGPWAKRYLGMNLTPQQFLYDNGLQDRLARAVLGDYVRRYGYQGAASAWYSGNPNLYNSARSQGAYPTIKRYVDSVMSRMGSTPTQVAAESAAMPAVKELMADQPGTASPVPLGLDIESGAGQGQLGLEAADGNESPTDQGIGIKLNEDPTKNPLEVSTRENFSELTGPVDIGAPSTGSGDRMSPVPGFKPSGVWGHYASGGNHPALDFAVPMGTAVRAPMSGTIVSAGWESTGFGLAVRMKNADGTYTILGHLSSLQGIRPGMAVKAGQVLALSGNSGNSTGPHLHMEMRHSLYDPRSAFNFSGMFKW